MNARWAEGRDSLRTLLDEMNAIPRMNPRYLPLIATVAIFIAVAQ